MYISRNIPLLLSFFEWQRFLSELIKKEVPNLTTPAFGVFLEKRGLGERKGAVKKYFIEKNKEIIQSCCDALGISVYFSSSGGGGSYSGAGGSPNRSVSYNALK